MFLKTKISSNKKTTYFLGIPFFKQVIKKGKKKKYLFGIRYYKKKIQNQSNVQEIHLNQPNAQEIYLKELERLFMRLEGMRILRERANIKLGE